MSCHIRWAISTPLLGLGDRHRHPARRAGRNARRGHESQCGCGDHVANYVEAQVIEWIKQMLAYPQPASGVLVSGASVANLVCLTVARDSMAGYDVRSQGLQGAQKRMTLYASSEVHSCIERAVDILGLGCESLRLIPVNQDYQIDLQALRAAIAADRRAGFQPFCVVGNAGTVNTGAIDDLPALADLCQEQGLWFHVDGAIGSVFGALT